jgi:uncharacterized protein (DUF885 family)
VTPAEQTRARARALADQYWDRFLALEPLVATQVGDERFDDLLPDLSAEGLAHREAVHRGALHDLAAFDRERLDPESRTALAVVETLAANGLAAIKYRFDRFDAAGHLFGPGSLLPRLGALQQADTPERLTRYVARLSALPGFLATSAAALADARASKQTSPRLVVDRTIAQVGRLLDTDPDASPALSPVPNEDRHGRQRVVETLRDVVYTAYEEYLGVLREYRPAAQEALGIGALPGGDELYAAKVRIWTTLELGPESIHVQGVEDLQRIQEERREVAARLGASNPEAAIQAYSASARNAFASRQDIVDLAEDQVRRGWEASKGFFGRLPEATCVVKPVDPAREDDILEYYQPATADGARPPIYYVSTKDPTRRPRHSLAAVTFHEANPGHHLQIALEQESADRPAVRRFCAELIGSSFMEGWALYSERLADEMGLYQDDYERLGMLEGQAFRAARLVVDTGIHAFRWDRERAIDTMASTGTDRPTCEVEVDRYVADPGQALTYRLGQRAIERWRVSDENREAARFSLAAFHDRLLALGSLPLPVIEAELGENGA